MSFSFQLNSVTYNGMILKPLLVIFFNNVDDFSDDKLYTHKKLIQNYKQIWTHNNLYSGSY